jgi:hypothetical protein
VAKGMPVAELVGKPVAEYISEQRLYCASDRGGEA